jgi:hypothetical protein
VETKEPTVEEIVTEAIDREQYLLCFYERSLRQIGNEAEHVFADLAAQSHLRLARLRQLLDDIESMRQCSTGMAD